ncbi:MAG: choice-of-anchor tandem repeat GloVer-containing protein [Candidatus Korobacteraceae bacterium]|jgi:uncharacterized repeat protein (TIGR03803 family)
MQYESRRISASLVPALVLFAMCAATASAQNHYQVLYNFGSSYNDAYAPEAPPTLAPDGSLYGTTAGGGGDGCNGYGCGTAYHLVRNSDGTWSLSIIHSFNGQDGWQPSAPVALDQLGDVYVPVYESWPFGYGTLVELLPQSGGQWSEVALHDFSGTGNDSSPGPVLVKAPGNVYGVTYGQLLDINSAGELYNSLGTANHLTIVHAFEVNPNDGMTPTGLVFDSSGNIFGTTCGGGAYRSGTVFELTPRQQGTGWNEKILYSFKGGQTDTYCPSPGPIFDSAGNLYGMTYDGGPANQGAVFKLAPNGDGTWTETIIYGFQGINDGDGPTGGLAIDQHGNLYGAAFAAGQFNSGTIFQLSPSSNGNWTFRVLYSFPDPQQGIDPLGVVLDRSGNLYGTTELGGQYGVGVAFELSP